MSSTSFMSSPNFLLNVLRADALSCVACGVLQVVFTGQMAQLLGLPEALLAYTGEFLLVYAAVVAFVSTRDPLPRPLVWVLLAGNLGWAIACALLLVSGRVAPSMLGTAYVVAQALTVAVLAELQFFGLRRSAPQPAW
ncbi:hypothetical protein [Polaromonas sp. JS666]|uniref:hypothetical protein n=1 Tax=Polaromonas sp. (strain JS666 / ATCC BAA-500) TaxID=296591 RepID=UPI0000463DA0|nr:hypothetical protein [Polaromonas sp. JS666]ABE45498.1 conserved hypothetical protein [Polaromonas sp. JS666]